MAQQAAYQKKPGSRGNRAAGFLVLALGVESRDVASYRAANSQIEKAQIASQRDQQDPDAVRGISQMADDKWGKEKADDTADR